MFGIVLGTICLIALVKLHRAHRFAHLSAFGLPPSHHAHHGPWMHHYGHARRHRFARFARHRGLHTLSAAIDATPGQEKVIRAAFDELRTASRDLRGEWKTSRADLAAALREPSLDAERLGLAFARHDEHLRRLREAFVSAVAKVHDALDERQRAQLAKWLERGGFPFPGHLGDDAETDDDATFGPYR